MNTSQDQASEIVALSLFQPVISWLQIQKTTVKRLRSNSETVSVLKYIQINGFKHDCCKYTLPKTT